MNDPRFRIEKNLKEGNHFDSSNTFSSGIKLDMWHINHYFHFIEVLLGVWAHSKKMKKIQVIVCPIKLNKSFADILNIAFPNSQIINKENYFIEECIVADRFEKDLGKEKLNLNKMLINSLEICTNSYKDLKKSIFKHFDINERKNPKKIEDLNCIFVNRKPPRILQNSSNFITYVQKRYNISINRLSFDYMSLKEQIVTVANTDILIGVHGNGLTNLLWLPDHGATIEMFGNYHHYDYQILSEISSTKYFGFLNDIDEEIIFRNGTRFMSAEGSTNKPIYKLKLDTFEKGFNEILKTMFNL